MEDSTLHTSYVGRNQSDMHGMRRTPEYEAWRGMKRRCYKPSCSKYEQYGGRGISVCERWRHSFDAFIADMGPKPSPDMSLDRINVDGDYEPSNCRWADPNTQMRNRTDSILVEWNGKIVHILDVPRHPSISEKNLRKRIRARGWSAKDAVSIPAKVGANQSLRK